jgi:hypothetical protein
MQGASLPETTCRSNHKSKHITGFLYDNTKEDLTWITDQNFSFYRYINQKLLTLNSLSLEVELAPSEIVFQTPENVQHCHSPSSNTSTKAHNCTELTLGIV